MPHLPPPASKYRRPSTVVPHTTLPKVATEPLQSGGLPLSTWYETLKSGAPPPHHTMGSSKWHWSPSKYSLTPSTHWAAPMPLKATLHSGGQPPHIKARPHNHPSWRSAPHTSTPTADIVPRSSTAHEHSHRSCGWASKTAH